MTWILTCDSQVRRSSYRTALIGLIPFFLAGFMMRSSVTVSLVPEARGGPFVFWDDLPGACQAASQLGFDAIELFPPGADAVPSARLATLLGDHQLRLAAVGTGAGWVTHRLHLCLPDAGARQAARAFIQAMIDFAGEHQAPVIIGSMQGRSSDEVSATTAREYLRESLEQLGEHAARHQVPLLFEPINRYESNLVNSVEQGLSLLGSLATRNVRLLADLFHMNIEDTDIASSLRTAGDRIGHVHFVDSNRRPAGWGHLDYVPIIAALRAIQYEGYLSAEALPYPDSQAAARQTIETFRQLCAAPAD